MPTPTASTRAEYGGAHNKTIRIGGRGYPVGCGYDRKAAKVFICRSIDFAGTYFYNQRTINLLGEDAKLPTMSFDPSTQSFKYNILITPTERREGSVDRRIYPHGSGGDTERCDEF